MTILLYSFIFLIGMVAGIISLAIVLDNISASPNPDLNSSTLIIPLSIFMKGYKVSPDSWYLNDNHVAKKIYDINGYVMGAEPYGFNRIDTYLYRSWNNKKIKKQNKIQQSAKLDILKDSIQRDIKNHEKGEKNSKIS